MDLDALEYGEILWGIYPAIFPLPTIWIAIKELPREHRKYGKIGGILSGVLK